MSRTSKPWKRSFRKIPESILRRVEELSGKPIRIACSRIVPREQIEQGYFGPLGISVEGDRVLLPTRPILPPEGNGVWARRNKEGWDIARRDLPKVSKSFYIESPNFGDWSKGSHEVEMSRMVYQREVLVGPRNICIKISSKGMSPDKQGFLLIFELEDVFDPNDRYFRNQILFGVNLLQESVGCSGVFDLEASEEDLLRYKFINWIIFPPGQSDEEYEVVVRKLPHLSEEARANMYERRSFLESLKPRQFICGIAFGENTYFGAQFQDDLVVFENIAVGNAIYVMYEDWEKLSKLSRSELLKKYENYRRIFHSGDWRRRLRLEIERHS